MKKTLKGCGKDFIPFHFFFREICAYVKKNRTKTDTGG